MKIDKTILLCKMIYSVCRLVRENCLTQLQKFSLGLIDSSMGFVRKIVKFYVS